MFEECDLIDLIFSGFFFLTGGITINRFDMGLRRDFGFLNMFDTVIDYRDC